MVFEWVLFLLVIISILFLTSILDFNSDYRLTKAFALILSLSIVIEACYTKSVSYIRGKKLVTFINEYDLKDVKLFRLLPFDFTLLWAFFVSFVQLLMLWDLSK